jgi:hypothetical protein
MFLFFVACKNRESKKSIVGKWRPVEISLHQLDEDEKNLLLHSIMEFTKDGKYSLSSSLGTNFGTYTYNEKEDSLIIDEFDSPPEKFAVILKEEKLTITSDEGTVKLKQQ